MSHETDQPFLPFARPDIGEAEIAAVAAAMRSGWVTTGPQARAFEEEFAAFIGGGVQAVAVNSATAGLHLALEALGIGAGDEVIVPSLTFTATAEVARYLGADVRFADVDARTLCVDAAAVEAAITPRTRAILPVHYGGLACDMAAIGALAERHGVHVVEDAAHALPATSGGQRIGSLAGSSAAVFSFYANKTMTTGEGGMAVVRDAKLAARMRVMRLHGIDRDAFARFTSRTPAWYYEVVAPGFKYNMTDVAAALGRVQLQRVEAMAQRRAALAARYLEELQGLPLTLPAAAPAGEAHAWHLFVLRLTDEARTPRDDLIDALARRGVGCSVHYVPLHRQPYWRDRYGLRPEQFPQAEAAWQRMLSIPLFSAMSDEEQGRVIAALRAELA